MLEAGTQLWKYSATGLLLQFSGVSSQPTLLFKVQESAGCVCRAARAVRAPRAVSSPGRENGSHNDEVDGDNTTADSTEQKE